MEVRDSYDDLYSRAEEAIAEYRREEATALLKRLVDRLLSLPPRILERKPDLQELLERAAGGYVTMLRWGGQNVEALAAINHFQEALPVSEPVWSVERAFNLIDSGRTSEGLDLLRALVLDPRRTSWTLRGVLLDELRGAGQYQEAEQVGKSLLRDAPDDMALKRALASVLNNAIEMEDAKAVVRYVGIAGRRTGAVPIHAYEWLAASRHWDQLEREITKGLWLYSLQRVFAGEIQKARGDEAGARETWQAILGIVEDESGLDAYARTSAQVLLEAASGETTEIALEILSRIPLDSAMLLIYTAASAQMGRIEDALTRIREYIQLSRLFRPFYRVLPHSYWLRLRRYPMPDGAVDALRPYFAAGQAEGPA